MEVNLLDHEDHYMLRFERQLAHPPEKVWRALTEREHLSQWYPFTAQEIDLREGGKIRFDDGNGSVHEATITELDPPRVFAFRENAGELLQREGENVLRFELTPHAGGCLLVFTQTFHDRPAAASYAAGWQLCLDAMEQVLADEPVEWGIPPAELHEAFVEKFGLNAGASEATPEGWVVRFERQFMGSPVDRVWALLWGSESNGADGEPVFSKPGDPVPEAFTAEEIPAGAITRVEAPALLEYDWLADDVPAGKVRWELSHGPGGARLTLTQTRLEKQAGERERALKAWQARIERLAREMMGD